MKASELIRRAVEVIEFNASPYQTELVTQLRHLHFATLMHERVVSSPQIPTETALGHRPCGITVAGHSTHTDAGLAALDGGD